MIPVYIASDSIITSLGFTPDENINALAAGETGIKLHHNEGISPKPFWASMVDHERLRQVFPDFATIKHYTRFEQLMITSVHQAVAQSTIDIKSSRTLCIVSTTKGNVDILNSRSDDHRFDPERVYLWNTAQMLQKYFGFSHTPLVISNACISGVLAVIIGARLIRSGRFDHVIVTGADLVTEFVLSGFNSFLSLCQGPCKPFDKDRQGLSLGEAAGTLVLTGDKTLSAGDGIQIGQGCSTNDANHISGPSRTGEGLYQSIMKTMGSNPQIPGFISAHGTATPYNDEMESVALTRAELNQVPVNSFKGYWGHTLGAAGIIETIASVYSIRRKMLFKTLGYTLPGTTNPIAVIDSTIHTPVKNILKIASGFGGSNASLIINQE